MPVTLGQGTPRVLLLGAATGGLVVLLEIAEVRLPLMGTTALVALIPVALGVALGGPPAGGIAAVVAIGGVAAVVGGSAAVAVLLRHVLPGLTLGAALRRRLSFSLSLTVVGGASLVGLGTLVWTYLPAGATAGGLLGRQIHAHAAEVERLAGQWGLVRDPATAAESLRLVVRTLEVAGPAVLLVGLLLTALANYVGARLCLRGRGFRPFAAEALPDHLVWGVIVAGALLVSQQETAAALGLNVLIVVGAFYAIQGLAVLRHFFQKVRVPGPLQALSFGIFAVQPLLLVAAACLGLADLWIDFRKIRRAPTPA